MDGKFPECSLFLEMVPSLLNSVSTMAGLRGREGRRMERLLWAAELVSHPCLISIASHHAARADRGKVEVELRASFLAAICLPDSTLRSEGNGWPANERVTSMQVATLVRQNAGNIGKFNLTGRGEETSRTLQTNPDILNPPVPSADHPRLFPPTNPGVSQFTPNQRDRIVDLTSCVQPDCSQIGHPCTPSTPFRLIRASPVHSIHLVV